jgi:hypothetical protein
MTAPGELRPGPRYIASRPSVTGQGAAHSGQNAWERAQYANEPSQFKQQTGVVPRQPHAPPAACTVGLRSCAEQITNTNTIAAIARNFFMVSLLRGFD